jgi:hypothetical protein
MLTGYNLSKLMVYPNPITTGAQLTILGTNKESSLKIYNLFGACVGSIAGTEGITKLNLNLPAGIYFIRSGNNTAKIVVLK